MGITHPLFLGAFLCIPLLAMESNPLQLQEQLRQAIDENNAERAAHLIEAGANQNPDDESLLVRVLERHRYALVMLRTLLEHGAPLKFNGTDIIPFFMDSASLESLIELCEAEPDINRPYQHNNTLLHLAITDADVMMVRYLMTRHATVDALNKSGVTPLALALLTGKNDSAICLLACGASPNVQAPDGLTPFHFAILAENYAIVGLLLKYGAKTDIRAHGRIENYPETVATPLDMLRYDTQWLASRAAYKALKECEWADDNIDDYKSIDEPIEEREKVDTILEDSALIRP